MTRGKCQACGRYADLERVELRVRGRVVFDSECCRRCADDVETAVLRTVGETYAIWSAARRLARVQP